MAPPRTALCVVVGSLMLSACATDPGAPPAPSASATPTPTPTSTASAGSASPTPTAAGGDPGAVAANELGRVPVLMYHQIIAKPGRDDRTPAQFRAELQMLYDEGYRPVTASDFVAGRIDIPAGTHAAVLTFDDSTVSQAQIGPDGEPTPDSALGILEAFGDTHPDFAPTATFYVNTSPEPFVDDKVMPWLAAHDYEIGAHTKSHAALRKLSDAGVQAEIGANITEIQAAVPGYTVTTLAVTYGVHPVNRELTHAGVHEGTAYSLAGVLSVDAVAAPSPFAARFDPFRVPRIGSGLAVTDVAFASLRKKPATRYTSDGDPGAVSFPAALAADLDPEWQGKARPY